MSLGKVAPMGACGPFFVTHEVTRRTKLPCDLEGHSLVINAFAAETEEPCFLSLLLLV